MGRIDAHIDLVVVILMPLIDYLDDYRREQDQTLAKLLLYELELIGFVIDFL